MATTDERGSSAPFGSRLLGRRSQSDRLLRIRVQTLLTLLLVGTNVIGAGIVVVISSFVVPAPPQTDGTRLALYIAVPIYVVVAVVGAGAIGTASTLRALRWAVTGESPSDADRRRTLRVPLRLTQVQGLMWLGAAVLFTTLALVIQPARAVATGLTVGIAGLVVCAIAYLLTEFTLRPIAARALSGWVDRASRGLGVGNRMVLFWCIGTAAPIVGLVVAAILALTTDDTSRTRLAGLALALGGVVLVFGLLVTVLNARAVVAPILSVRDALLAVERGDLDQEVPVYDGTELGLLQAGFNDMVTGLREREHIRDLFGRHVGQEVARAASTGDVELGGESRVVSVIFVDLVGSTTYAVERGPAEVVDMLNRFFGVVVDEVDRHQGLVNKFMGDAVLAVFGAPLELDDHAGAALAAARSMARRLSAEVPEIGAGIGVSTGEAVAGNVGHRSRFEYTVIGDAVNSAARLTELAKDTEGLLLASWDSVESAGSEEAAHWQRHRATTLRGRRTETVLAVPVTSDGG